MRLFKTVQRTVGATVLLSLLSLPAMAQLGPGQWEVGFDLGGTELDNQRGGDTGVSLSVRGGYHFTKFFQLEGQVRAVELENDFGPEDVALTMFFVNAVFNFHPTEHIVPYVLVGLGEAETEVYEDYDHYYDDDHHRNRRHRDHRDFRTIDSADAGQVAVGSRFFVGEKKRLAIRIEAAMIFEEGFDNNNEHITVAGGLTWRLGGGRQRVGDP